MNEECLSEIKKSYEYDYKMLFLMLFLIFSSEIYATANINDKRIRIIWKIFEIFFYFLPSHFLLLLRTLEQINDKTMQK